MFEAAIIGAGPLGSALAHIVARQDVAAAVRLIDEADGGRVAAGMALDLMQSAPIHQFATQITSGRDASEAAGASVVIIADRAAPTARVEPGAGGSAAEWQGAEAMQLLKRLAFAATERTIICAGATQLDLVERGVREFGLPRRHILGTAPEALASALRALAAIEINGSPADVALTVLGAPPSGVIVPWQDATIGGISAVRVLDEPARRRLAARVAALWPPGPYALAHAAALGISALAGRSRRQLSAFVAPDDSMGRRARAVAMPVVLDPAGIRSFVSPALETRDRVALETVMQL